MDIYHKWKELLSDFEKRREWIEYYRKNDPIFNAVMDFCGDRTEVSYQDKLELALIAILDQKIKTLSENHKMAHSMCRPLPRKLVMGQSDFGRIKGDH